MAAAAIPCDNNEYLERLQQHVTCPVCLDIYDSPQLLQCSHTICKRCLLPLIKRGNVVKCPQCRQIGHLSRVQNNLTMTQTLELYQQENKVVQDRTAAEKELQETELCSFCHVKQIQLLCRNCMTGICTGCQEQHIEFNHCQKSRFVPATNPVSKNIATARILLDKSQFNMIKFHTEYQNTLAYYRDDDKTIRRMIDNARFEVMQKVNEHYSKEVAKLESLTREHCSKINHSYSSLFDRYCMIKSSLKALINEAGHDNVASSAVKLQSIKHELHQQPDLFQKVKLQVKNVVTNIGSFKHREAFEVSNPFDENHVDMKDLPEGCRWLATDQLFKTKKVLHDVLEIPKCLLVVENKLWRLCKNRIEISDFQGWVEHAINLERLGCGKPCHMIRGFEHNILVCTEKKFLAFDHNAKLLRCIEWPLCQMRSKGSLELSYFLKQIAYDKHTQSKEFYLTSIICQETCKTKIYLTKFSCNCKKLALVLVQHMSTKLYPASSEEHVSVAALKGNIYVCMSSNSCIFRLSQEGQTLQCLETVNIINHFDSTKFLHPSIHALEDSEVFLVRQSESNFLVFQPQNNQALPLKFDDVKTFSAVKTLVFSLTQRKLFFVSDQKLENGYPLFISHCISMNGPEANGGTTTEKGREVTQTGNTATQTGNAVTQTGNAVTQTGNAVTQRRNAVTQTRNTVTQTENAVTQRRNAVTQTRNTVTQTGNAVIQTRNTVIQTRNAVTQGRTTVTQTGNAVTQRRTEVTQTENIVLQIGNVIHTQTGNAAAETANEVIVAESVNETTDAETANESIASLGTEPIQHEVNQAGEQPEQIRIKTVVKNYNKNLISMFGRIRQVFLHRIWGLRVDQLFLFGVIYGIMFFYFWLIIVVGLKIC